ncbi:hypothetical protein VFPYRLAN_016 [Candidatus Vidania fulgoroideae]|nr:hypothetical protein VFPYRLAN_016 [Candidatus Vidania fulgoroideae]
MILKDKEIFIDFFFGYYKERNKVFSLLRKIDSFLKNNDLRKNVYLRAKYKLFSDRLVLYIKTDNFFRYIKYKVLRFSDFSSYSKYISDNLFKSIFFSKVFYYKNRIIVKERKLVFVEMNKVIFNCLKKVFKRRYLFDESNHKRILSFLKKRYGVNFFTIIVDDYPFRKTNFCFFLKGSLYFKKCIGNVIEYKKSIYKYLDKKKEIFFFFKEPKNIRKVLKFIYLNKVSIFKFKFKKKEISYKILKKELKKRNGRLFAEKKNKSLILRTLEKKNISPDKRTSLFLKKKIFSSILCKKRN